MDGHEAHVARFGASLGDGPGGLIENGAISTLVTRWQLAIGEVLQVMLDIFSGVLAINASMLNASDCFHQQERACSNTQHQQIAGKQGDRFQRFHSHEHQRKQRCCQNLFTHLARPEGLDDCPGRTCAKVTKALYAKYTFADSAIRPPQSAGSRRPYQIPGHMTQRSLPRPSPASAIRGKPGGDGRVSCCVCSPEFHHCSGPRK